MIYLEQCIPWYLRLELARWVLYGPSGETQLISELVGVISSIVAVGGREGMDRGQHHGIQQGCMPPGCRCSATLSHRMEISSEWA